MKLHLSDVHMAGTAHRLHGKEERWISSHAMMTAIIIACLITGLLVCILSLVHIYLTTGTWPLWS